MKLKQIQKAIKLYPAPISELARVSGVPRETIRDIRDGKSQNPGIVTVSRILDAMEKTK